MRQNPYYLRPDIRRFFETGDHAVLEAFEVGAPAHHERLCAARTATCARLEPLLPAEEPRLARWRLRLDGEPDEFRALVAS
jgi:hypothetical protein